MVVVVVVVEVVVVVVVVPVSNIHSFSFFWQNLDIIEAPAFFLLANFDILEATAGRRL